MFTSNLLGFNVFNKKLEDCVALIVSGIRDGSRPAWLACLNAHSFVSAQRDSEFFKALQTADILIPDGVGITLASKILKGNLKSRITGPDVFYALNERMNKEGGFSVFFFGSDMECLNLISERMQRDYPKICICGVYSPPFKEKFEQSELEEMVEIINASKPDVLWVAMTAPKQEKWIFNNLTRLDIRFAGAVGAVFDFYAGRIKRANRIFQRFGFEWLYRFVCEPRRLWRRNLSAPVFLIYVFREFIRSRK